MALNFARTKRFDEFSKDELTYLAAKAKLPSKLVMVTATDTVERFHEAWRRLKPELRLPKKAVAAIEEHLQRVPLAAEQP